MLSYQNYVVIERLSRLHEWYVRLGTLVTLVLKLAQSLNQSDVISCILT